MPLDVAQGLGELDGKGDTEVAVDSPKAVRDGHGLLNESYTLRHSGKAGGRGVAETDIPRSPYDHWALGVDLDRWTRGLVDGFIERINHLF